MPADRKELTRDEAAMRPIRVMIQEARESIDAIEEYAHRLAPATQWEDACCAVDNLIDESKRLEQALTAEWQRRLKEGI